MKPVSQKPVCSVPGCGRISHSRGYCVKHYTQVYRHGRLTPEKEHGSTRICEAPGCTRVDTSGKKYCRKHSRQIKVHGRLTPELERLPGKPECTYPGCKRKHRAKGLCALHYNREHLHKKITGDNS